MCLTIPKKVIEIKKGSVILEAFDGNRQEAKSVVELLVGDFCVTQQNVVIQKLSNEEAEEIFKIMKNGR